MSISTDRLAATAASCLKSGDETGAVRALEDFAAVQGADVSTAMSCAQVARAIDRNDIALNILSHFRKEVSVQIACLQLRQEWGEETADALRALLPNPLTADRQTLQLAGALHAEGRVQEAVALLQDVLHRDGLWIAGHQTLSNLRWQFGDGENAPASFAEAARRFPQATEIWAAWAGTLNSAGRPHEAVDVIGRARSAGAIGPILDMIESEALSTNGEAAAADAVLARLTMIDTPDFEASRMRHAMRHSRFDAAVQIGNRVLGKSFHGECWAWMGAAWRALDDPRSDWFHRGLQFVATRDLDLDPVLHGRIVALLKKLHGDAKHHPLNQSPRGGTQTMGPLFKRAEPELRDLRKAILGAVRSYISALPERETSHPFLSAPRDGVRIEGAWSVRLRPQGRHVAHIHSHGWISSALYLELPDETKETTRQSGWFEVGQPLLPERWAKPPLARIQPTVGKLALFPSLFWHGTVPFDSGERLTVAFDIVPA